MNQMKKKINTTFTFIFICNEDLGME